jgi:hypothetical protein
VRRSSGFQQVSRIVVASLLLTAARPVLPQAEKEQVEQVVEYSVTVYQARGGEPGVPILVRLKDRDGKVIVESRTNSAGAVRLKIAADTVAATLEAVQDLGSGRSIGVIDTVNGGCKSYEVFLPQYRALQCQGAIERPR